METIWIKKVGELSMGAAWGDEEPKTMATKAVLKAESKQRDYGRAVISEAFYNAINTSTQLKQDLIDEILLNIHLVKHDPDFQKLITNMEREWLKSIKKG